MSFSNLSSSRAPRNVTPAVQQDNVDQGHWASCPEEDDENYQHLYMRVPAKVKPKKHPLQEKNGLSYIDKSIALCAPTDPNLLNTKLQKFFKTLTKNYKPLTPRSKEKSPRNVQLPAWHENLQNPGEHTQSEMTQKENLFAMKKSLSKDHKCSSQDVVNFDKTCGSHDENDVPARGRIDNMYLKLIAQESGQIQGKAFGDNSNKYHVANSRSLSNPTRQSLEERPQESTERTHYRKLSNVPFPNIPSQENSGLPCFNQNSIEENCNYAYLKNFEKEYDEAHPYQKYLMSPESISASLQDSQQLRGPLPFSKYSQIEFSQKRDSKESLSQSHRSSLKNLDILDKKSSKTLDTKRSGSYLSQGNPIINHHFSDRGDEFEPYRPSTSLPGIAGVYSSILSDSKDENPNYTGVVKMVGSQSQISSSNEVRIEEEPWLAKKGVLTSSFRKNSEENKIKTTSQATDRLDSSEIIFAKQKACFHMFFALNNVAFQGLNSVFQDIKKASGKPQEFIQRNFASFGYAARQQSARLNKEINRYQQHSGTDLEGIVHGFSKVSSLARIIEVSMARTKQSVFERLALRTLFKETRNVERVASSLSKLSSLCKSQRKVLLLQSFSKWSSCMKIEKVKESETAKFQQLTQILTKEKQKLQEELTALKSKPNPSPDRITQQQKDLKSFMRTMEAPVGPLRLREESINSLSNTSNLSIMDKENKARSPLPGRPPLSRLQATNSSSDAQDQIKMFNGAIKKACEQEASKQSHKKLVPGLEYGIGSQDSSDNPERRKETETHFNSSQTYIESLKKQATGKYNNRIISPSSQNCYESRAFDQESSRGSRGDVNAKIESALNKVFMGPGASQPKELTEEDEFLAESPQARSLSRSPPNHRLTFFESMDGFDQVNTAEQFSEDAITMDQSEIMKERIGDMKSIRGIAHGLNVRDFDESMIGSEGEQSFYRNEHFGMFKRE